MSKYLKRATITVDELAQEYFPQADAQVRRQADVLAELQERLQDKGDDPRYCRVIFAVEGQDRFVETNERNVTLAGVFPRITCVRYEYGRDNQGLRNVMGTNIRDTLVVANSEVVARIWGTELKSLEYDVRRL